jgi:hypothetical protein
MPLAMDLKDILFQILLGSLFAPPISAHLAEEMHQRRTGVYG